MNGFSPNNPSFDSFTGNLEYSIILQLQESSEILREIIRQNTSALQELNGLVGNLRTIKRSRENERSLSELLGVVNCEFSLELKEGPPAVLCKGKVFTFEVKLTGGFPKNEALDVFVSVYSSDRPPKQITRTMNGNNILKGNMSTKLNYNSIEKVHTGWFRLLLNEVTSHFMNGRVSLVVNADQQNGHLQGTGHIVSPLILDNIICRAKSTGKSR